MALGASQIERRQFGRRRLTIHAWVLIAQRQPIACVVRNLSPRGALLEFAEAAPAPAYFRLRIDADGFEAACEVRHRRSDALGVSFVATENSAADAPAPVNVKRVVALMRSQLRAQSRD